MGFMPFVQIILLKGRTREQKKNLVKKVSNAVSESLGVPLDAVHIGLIEVDDASWGTAGVTVEEKKRKERQEKKVSK